MAAAAQIYAQNMAKLRCTYIGRSDKACGRVRQRDQADGSESGVAAPFTKGGTKRPVFIVRVLGIVHEAQLTTDGVDNYFRGFGFTDLTPPQCVARYRHQVTVGNASL